MVHHHHHLYKHINRWSKEMDSQRLLDTLRCARVYFETHLQHDVAPDRVISGVLVQLCVAGNWSHYVLLGCEYGIKLTSVFNVSFIETPYQQ